MRYLVDGADKTSGDNVRMELTASSLADAEHQAIAAGVLVSSVAPLSRPYVQNRPPAYTWLGITGWAVFTIGLLTFAFGMVILGMTTYVAMMGASAADEDLAFVISATAAGGTLGMVAAALRDVQWLDCEEQTE